METIDVNDDVEIMLQEAHDEEFVYVAPRRVYVERCITCSDKPLWGCKIFGCKPTESCFILCPTCGKRGNDKKPESFVGDPVLAYNLRQALDIPEPLFYT